MKKILSIVLVLTLLSCSTYSQSKKEVKTISCGDTVKILISPKNPQINKFSVAKVSRKDNQKYEEITPTSRFSYEEAKSLLVKILIVKDNSELLDLFEFIDVKTQENLINTIQISNKSIKLYGMSSLTFEETTYIIAQIEYDTPLDILPASPSIVFIRKNSNGKFKFLNFVYNTDTLDKVTDNEALKNILTKTSKLNFRNLEKLSYYNRFSKEENEEKEFIEELIFMITDDKNSGKINLQRLFLKLDVWEAEENEKLLNFFYN